MQGSSQAAISENIRRERDAGKKPAQAAAIAYSVARKNKKGARLTAKAAGLLRNRPSLFTKDFIAYLQTKNVTDDSGHEHAEDSGQFTGSGGGGGGSVTAEKPKEKPARRRKKPASESEEHPASEPKKPTADMTTWDHFQDRMGRHWLLKSDDDDNEVARVGPFNSAEEAKKARAESAKKSFFTPSLIRYLESKGMQRG